MARVAAGAGVELDPAARRDFCLLGTCAKGRGLSAAPIRSATPTSSPCRNGWRVTVSIRWLGACRRRREAADLGGEQPGEFDRRRVLALRPDDLQADWQSLCGQ